MTADWAFILFLFLLLLFFFFFFICGLNSMSVLAIQRRYRCVKLRFTGVYVSFHISAQNIDVGYSLKPPRRGGSNKYPQSMFLSRNMKINVYPCKPYFYCIKVGFKGVKTIFS